MFVLVGGYSYNMFCLVVVFLMWSVRMTFTVKNCNTWTRYNHTNITDDLGWNTVGCIRHNARDVFIGLTFQSAANSTCDEWTVFQHIDRLPTIYPLWGLSLLEPYLSIHIPIVNNKRAVFKCAIEKKHDPYFELLANKTITVSVNPITTTLMLTVCTFPDEDMDSIVQPGGRHILTQEGHMHFIYRHIENCTVQLYRSSTGTHLFLRQESNTIIGNGYVNRLLIEDGNVTLSNVSCADEGVYIIYITPFNKRHGHKYTYTVYAPHGCRDYTINAVVGGAIVILPFSTTHYGSGWLNNNVNVENRPILYRNGLTVNDSGICFTFVDEFNMKVVCLNLTTSPLTVTQTCSLTRYRWYYKGIKVPTGPFFVITDNRITGFGSRDDYTCRGLEDRSYIVLGSVVGFCLFVLGCVLCLYSYRCAVDEKHVVI